ncbi:MAG: hypothetical protein N4A72_13005 [Bacteroidales bacterium]|jgi:hypothetical protein|nr:hypothetical protein [Bacteroidales bacterium]
MKDDFRQAYFEAREIIAQELKKKYNLIESFKDDNKLTLTSSKCSIHLSFNIPDGTDVSITKYKENDVNDSFMGLVVKKYPNLQEMGNYLKEAFKPRESYNTNFDYIISSIKTKVKFIEENFSFLFISL